MVTGAFQKVVVSKRETPHQTAFRELREETNLTAKSCIDVPFEYDFSENYRVSYDDNLFQKYVTYYPCYVVGDVVMQQDEVEDGKWVTVDDLASFFQFKEQLEHIPFIKQLVLYLHNDKSPRCSMLNEVNKQQNYETLFKKNTYVCISNCT